MPWGQTALPASLGRGERLKTHTPGKKRGYRAKLQETRGQKSRGCTVLFCRGCCGLDAPTSSPHRSNGGQLLVSSLGTPGSAAAGGSASPATSPLAPQIAASLLREPSPALSLCSSQKGIFLASCLLPREPQHEVNTEPSSGFCNVFSSPAPDSFLASTPLVH